MMCRVFIGGHNLWYMCRFWEYNIFKVCYKTNQTQNTYAILPYSQPKNFIFPSSFFNFKLFYYFFYCFKDFNIFFLNIGFECPNFSYLVYENLDIKWYFKLIYFGKFTILRVNIKGSLNSRLFSFLIVILALLLLIS